MDFYRIGIEGDPIAIQDYNNWLQSHKNILNFVFAILRHPAYCLDNLAFYCNIERWARLIIREFKISRPSNSMTSSSTRSGRSLHRYNKRWFKIISGVLITISSFFMIFQMLGFQFDLYFYIIQGLILMPSIVAGYIIIY